MKRNNILMGAYIAFIVICFIVRTFTEYPMWRAIVSAVTISSAFFAYADFFGIYAQAFSDICEVAEKFILDTRNKLENELRAFEEINERVKSVSKEEFDFSEVENITKVVMNRHDEMEIWIEDYAKRNVIKQKKVKNYKVISEALTFFGFLALLCILVFSPISSRVIKVQDLLSVLAFAVILLSQYMGAALSEKLEKDKREAKSAKRTHDESRIKLKELREMINRLVDMINDSEE